MREENRVENLSCANGNAKIFVQIDPSPYVGAFGWLPDGTSFTSQYPTKDELEQFDSIYVWDSNCQRVFDRLLPVMNPENGVFLIWDPADQSAYAEAVGSYANVIEKVSFKNRGPLAVLEMRKRREHADGLSSQPDIQGAINRWTINTVAVPKTEVDATISILKGLLDRIAELSLENSRQAKELVDQKLLLDQRGEILELVRLLKQELANEKKLNKELSLRFLKMRR